ncbi:rod-binding protein [Spirobacillus cienkowskii]|uniref:rod-binding protein n=1 Tax=Spirobacillus cienkowskii TaxID=495820 RepID=UPI0030D07A0A
MRINIMDNLLFKKTIPSEKETVNPKIKEAETVAKEFETIYLDMMLKSMRQTAKPENESNAHDIFQSMLDSEYSKIMAESQSFGIRDLILNWMKDNDPSLNPSLKILNSQNLNTDNNELFESKKVIENMKSKSLFTKLALQKYKID